MSANNSKILVFIFIAWAIFSFGAAAHAATLSLKQGEVLIYPLVNTQAGSEGYLGNTKMPLFQSGDKSYVLLAADVSKKTGNYYLYIKSGTKVLNKILVKVKLGSYKKVSTKVPYQFSTLSPEKQQIVLEERSPLITGLAKAAKEPAPKLWSTFREPLDKIYITSSFGFKRIYTNHSTIHQGVDLRAPIGTPVYAISDGEVLWGEQKSLYLEGPTIAIDHGEGIVSKYLHLSKVMVETGANVHAGDLIGYSGDQGADVNGAHLHFAIKVGDASVNPLQFIEEFQKIKSAN